MCLFYRVGAEVKTFSGDPNRIHSEVASRTLGDFLDHGAESGGDLGIGALDSPTEGNLPRLALVDVAQLAVSLGDESPANGHITRRTLEGSSQPDGVALGVTQMASDGVAGDGELGHVFFLVGG